MLTVEHGMTKILQQGDLAGPSLPPENRVEESGRSMLFYLVQLLSSEHVSQGLEADGQKERVVGDLDHQVSRLLLDS